MSLFRRTLRSLHDRIARLEERLNKVWLDSYLKELGIHNAHAIPTYTTPAELAALYRLSTGCPNGAQVVEIGSYLGASTCYLAAGIANRQGHLYCVDTWKNETMPDGSRDTFSEFSRNVAPLAGSIKIIRKDSSQLRASDLPDNISLAFIDGDHSYKAVRRDTEILKPKMLYGGVMAFHDALYFRGVSKCIADMLVLEEWRLTGQIRNLVWLTKTKSEQ